MRKLLIRRRTRTRRERKRRRKKKREGERENVNSQQKSETRMTASVRRLCFGPNKYEVFFLKNLSCVWISGVSDTSERGPPLLLAPFV